MIDHRTRCRSPNVGRCLRSPTRGWCGLLWFIFMLPTAAAATSHAGHRLQEGASAPAASGASRSYEHGTGECGTDVVTATSDNLGWSTVMRKRRIKRSARDGAQNDLHASKHAKTDDTAGFKTQETGTRLACRPQKNQKRGKKMSK